MKKLLLVLVLIGVALTAAAYWVSPSGKANEEGYTFENVQYGSLTEVVNVTGIVFPREIVLVYPMIPGNVDEILPDPQTPPARPVGVGSSVNQGQRPVGVGSRVNKGQPLVKLNTERTKQALESAQAALARTKDLEQSAQESCDKLQELKDFANSKDILKAKADLRAAKNAVKEAQSGVKQAELAMKWSTVEAPIAGIIIKKEVFVGQPVGPIPSTAGRGQSAFGGSSSSSLGLGTGGPLFIIAKDMENLEIQAQIPQSDRGRVEVGQEVKFTVDEDELTDIDNPEFKGKIQEIEFMPTSMQGAVFYPAKIQVTNRPRPKKKGKEPLGSDHWILNLGMNLSVDIVRRTHPDVWKIPKVALDFQLEDHYITPAAKRKLERKEALKNPSEWTPVWVMGKQNKPWPIFVRIGGKNGKGETGINDGNYTEVLEWDPDLDQQPVAGKEATYPKVIISAPPVKQSWLENVKIRVS
jgi:HlyD family secretion protein